MTDREKTLFAILGAIFEMSDRVKARGGTTCVAGIAAAHTIQTSIQKNKPRIMQMLGAERKEGDGK